MHTMLRDLRLAFHSLVLVLFVTVFANCSDGRGQAPLSWHVKFVSRGAEVHFDSASRRTIRQIRVLSVPGADEVVVAQLNLRGYQTAPPYFRGATANSQCTPCFVIYDWRFIL